MHIYVYRYICIPAQSSMYIPSKQCSPSAGAGIYASTYTVVQAHVTYGAVMYASTYTVVHTHIICVYVYMYTHACMYTCMHLHMLPSATPASSALPLQVRQRICPWLINHPARLEIDYSRVYGTRGHPLCCNTQRAHAAPPPPPPPTQTSWQVQASLHPTLALAPSSTPRPTHTQPRSRPVRRSSSGVGAATVACEDGQDYRKGMVSPSPPTTTHSATNTTATSSAPSAASSPSSTVSRLQAADVRRTLTPHGGA